MKKLIAIIGIIGLQITACNSNSSTRDCVTQVVSFVENQKDSCRLYSDTDWDRSNRIYIELLREANQYKDQMSLNEKRLIAQATTTYVLLQSHRKKEDLKNSLHP